MRRTRQRSRQATLGAGNRFHFASEGEKSHFAPPGAICAAAVLTWHARSFAPLASAMGATPPPAHLPERRACSCEGPKKAHRNLVGLRRTASRSPRSVLSARASSRSFITAIGVGRRDFTVWTGRQRALVAPGRPCPAPYAGCCPSLPKRIGRTEVRSPRPFRALVALAGRNLPPLCSNCPDCAVHRRPQRLRLRHLCCKCKPCFDRHRSPCHAP